MTDLDYEFVLEDCTYHKDCYGGGFNDALAATAEVLSEVMECETCPITNTCHPLTSCSAHWLEFLTNETL